MKLILKDILPAVRRFLPIFLWCAPALSGAATLTDAQLKIFDPVEAQAEEASCKSQTAAAEWIGAEFKKFGFEPRMTSYKAQTWKLSSLDFKADGEVLPAEWVQGSPGTGGQVNGKVLKGAADGNGIINGSFFDAGSGSAGDVTAAGGGEGKVWLVEMGDALPDAWVLGIEAKNRKAAAVVIFDGRPDSHHSWSVPNAATDSVVPMIVVSEETARKLKSKIKTGPVKASLSVTVDYPVSEEGQIVSVTQGDHPERTLVTARLNDCRAVGELIAMLDWTKKSKIKVSGTTWAVAAGSPESDPKYRDDFGTAASSYNLTSEEFPQFLSAWYKGDRAAVDSENARSLLRKMASVQEALKGVLDGESLRQYGELVRHLERSPKDAEVARGRAGETEIFSEMAVRLKTLRQAYALAQKGQWEQAAGLLKALPDMRWADNVSPSTYVEYESRKFAAGPDVLDPALWIELNKGKKNLDALLTVLEREIDRLDKRLADNFFKFQKSFDSGKNVLQ